MDQNFSARKATINDLPIIIKLLFEDDLGKDQEKTSAKLDQKYLDAFHKINADQNQYLMVVLIDAEIVGTCHLTIMLSLSFMGQTRMQIEGVRVATKHRGQRIGEWMLNAAIDYAQLQGATIIQLMTNKTRTRAKGFYEKLGFIASHEGMKLYL
ncbi:MAG: GNAT family N-acetyltransferase [Legionellales bacterium]|jgi:ribosomal protein S18 acetylase RimI-like enzyme